MIKRLTLWLMTALMVLGVSANDYTIYPVPHSITMGSTSTSITQTVNIQADATIDQATLNRAIEVLKEAGYTTTTNAESDGNTQLILATSSAIESIADGKYDRHTLNIEGNSITITGEHTTAVFCGLASLEQILEQKNADGTLTATQIQDWADQKNRGLVEGYYGYPYSVQVKKDLMHFMMRYKMNTYMYGAKSDPYHSQYWQDAYPTSITEEQEKNGWLSQDMVKELSATSAETKVNFIWAIHPGNNFVGSSTVITDIMGKFQKMHNLGVRQFAVFVDDVSIPSTDADMKTNADRLTSLQKAIEAKWNTEGALATDTVRPLHFVPQIYCSSFASSTDQRQRFMAALGQTPSYITIYTTGTGVWSVPNSSHMQNMNSELGRDMAWWWNYPCNDNADGQIYTMDMYSNFYDLPSVDGSARMPSNLTNTVGVVSNPMQEGEIAKTALFSVADYAWNNSGFNNDKSWEASFKPLISDSTTREAYRYLTRYLRWNEPSAVNTLIQSYKSSVNSGTPKPEGLQELMGTIIENCTIVQGLQNSEVESDRLLYNDLRPWLLKLKSDCNAISQLLDVLGNTDELNSKWQQYLDANNLVNDMKTNTDYTAYALEGMGNSISVSQRQAQVAQLYLEPFISYMVQNAMKGSFIDQRPTDKPVCVTNKSGISPNVVLTNTGMFRISLSTKVFQPGEYIGMELPQNYKIGTVALSDTLVANHAVLCSENGKQWVRVSSPTELPIDYVRYIIVVNNTDLPMSLKLSTKAINLTMVQKTTIVDCTIPTDTEVWQSHTKSYIMDGDYSTFCTLNRCQKSGDTYTVDLGAATPIEDVRICMGTTNGDYMTTGQVQISSGGTMWNTLHVMGGSATDYTLSLPQNVKYSSEMTYCDFDGEGRSARYVRLNVKTPNTSKWLRLYDIEVNRTAYDRAFRQICTDSEGVNLTNVIDGDGSTCLSSSQTSPVLYRLEEMAYIESLDVYSDLSNGVKTTVSVTNDGESWQQIATLTDACQHIDMGDYREAVAVRFEWTGDTAPAIYEVVPTYDAEGEPSVLTSVNGVTIDNKHSNSQTIYNLQGQKITRPAMKGLYIQNGRVRVM